MQNAWSFLCMAGLMPSFFNALLQVICKLLAKQFANKLNHDIIYARLEQVVAWRRAKKELVA